MKFTGFLRCVSICLVVSEIGGCVPKKPDTSTQTGTNAPKLEATWACAAADYKVLTSIVAGSEGILQTERLPAPLCHFTPSVVDQKEQCEFRTYSPKDCQSNREICERLPTFAKGCKIILQKSSLKIPANQRKVCRKENEKVVCAAACTDVSKNILVSVSYVSNCDQGN